MITYLKALLGLILIGLGCRFILSGAASLVLGLGDRTGSIEELIIGIALIAGAIALFIKVRG
jgi:hypothetical protein